MRFFKVLILLLPQPVTCCYNCGQYIRLRHTDEISSIQRTVTGIVYSDYNILPKKNVSLKEESQCPVIRVWASGV